MAALLSCTGHPSYGLLTLAYDLLLAAALWGCWRNTRSGWVALTTVPFLLHFGQAVNMVGPRALPRLPEVEAWPLLLSIPLVAFLVGNGLARSLGSRSLMLASWLQLLTLPTFLEVMPQNFFSEMSWYWGLFGLQGLLLFRARPRPPAELHLGLSPSQGEPGLAC